MSASVILRCFWYLYVLETLGYPMTYYLETLVMLPGVLFTFYNIISIWTGWSFTVSQDNIYAHGLSSVSRWSGPTECSWSPSFKKINDTLGHPTGDQALVNAAKILSGSLRGVRGILVRYGGNEFLIMVFFKDDAEAEAFRQKIYDRFAVSDQEQELPYHLAVSIGYASWADDMTLASLIHQADEDLYQVKQARR